MKFAAPSLCMLSTVLMASAALASDQSDRRVIFDNPGYQVTAPGDGTYCGQPARVTVESDDPELFERQAMLQSIVDGVQAVLVYECPDIATVEVNGRLRGITEPIYRGVAHRHSNWNLDTKKSFQSREYEEGSRNGDSWDEDEPTVGDGETSPAMPASEFNVANLQTGMTVDNAGATVEDTFGVQPSYDRREGLLSMRTGGCPQDYDWSTLSPVPQAGWKCLRGWFTDQREERLYLLELIQVVEGDQVHSIESLLAQQYGEPVHQRTQEKKPERWQDAPESRTSHVMAWGDVVQADTASAGEDQSSRYTLQAHITPIEDVTVLAVTLYQPDMQPDRATRDEPQDLDLNL